MSTEPSRIVRATAADAEAIATVMLAAFAGYEARYTAAAYRATVPAPSGVLARLEEGPMWIGRLNEIIVATGSAVVTDQGLYIRGMAVMPHARSHHFGRRLLETMERFARDQSIPRLYLCTTPFLERAIKLYERYGFQRSAHGPTDLQGTPLIALELELPSI